MNNLTHTLFLCKPELQSKLLMVYRRIHSDAWLEPELKQILTDALLNFLHSQKPEPADLKRSR